MAIYVRRYLVGFAAAVLLTALSGCRDKTEELTINSYLSDEAPKRVFGDLVERYRAQNPGVTVKVNTFAHEDFKTLLRTWLPNKSAPDVVTWFAGERMRYFAQKGLIAPINDIFLSGFDGDFPPAFRSACAWGDSIYFLPQSWYWWGVYYRKSVFARFGVSPPRTWDEVLGVCAKLKTGGVTPVAIGTKAPWTAAGWFDYLDMRVNGGRFHLDLTAGKIPFTDPRVRKAFDAWKELVDKDYFLATHTSYEWQAAATRLFNGEAGMYLMGQFIKDVAPAEIKPDLDFFRFPVIDTAVELYEDAPIDGFMIPANAAHGAQARRFLAFVGTRQAQEYFARNLGRLAANKNVPPPDAHAQTGLDMIQASKGIAQFFDRDSDPVIAEKCMNAFIEFMMHPENLDRILSDLETQRQSVYGERHP